MGDDRCRRSRRRQISLAGRFAAARQAQADFHAARRCGDNVIVINAAKVVLTGRKVQQKIYYKHTGYIGGIKERTAKSILAGRFPERIVEKAIERMLPRGPLGRRQLGNLRVYPQRRASARGAAAGKARYRRHEPQE